ncbi:MAG: SMC-Scp complex subunit ScpB [Rickettsiales bacterium]|nr:SMC-Scp complex subunit ScpB [Rickettsiales bacterium]|tara:strand:+ start:4122 stop:4766 length:645 start_codon:yes stop_codon:yes gene_type:complete
MTEEKDIKILEAILFASDGPVLEEDLKQNISNKNNLDDYLKKISILYNNRGINLVKTGNKWSFRTTNEIKDELTIIKKQKRKLSRAAIETLAIIAYQQPITRSEIENIRGVQMGRGSIDHLMEIGWIKPAGRKNIPGKPVLWSTTETFLEHFGINNLEDLPNKDELKASGFLEKRSAIATITDIAGKDDMVEDVNFEDETETLEDFIPETVKNN